MATHSLSFLAAVLIGILLAAPLALAQRGRGPGGPGRAADPAFTADREVYQFLLQHRAEIRRDVTKTARGVETVTESDNPEVAAALQKHVPAMALRVKKPDPIHLRDPLFAELFRHAAKIELTHEDTAQGVRVQETSDDPYVARLIQAHADVVSLFLKNGHAEVRKNHALPEKPSQL
jgi:hypothetical protein